MWVRVIHFTASAYGCFKCPPRSFVTVLPGTLIQVSTRAQASFLEMGRAFAIWPDCLLWMGFRLRTPTSSVGENPLLSAPASTLCWYPGRRLGGKYLIYFPAFQSSSTTCPEMRASLRYEWTVVTNPRNKTSLGGPLLMVTCIHR